MWLIKILVIISYTLCQNQASHGKSLKNFTSFIGLKQNTHNLKFTPEQKNHDMLLKLQISSSHIVPLKNAKKANKNFRKKRQHHFKNAFSLRYDVESGKPNRSPIKYIDKPTLENSAKFAAGYYLRYFVSRSTKSVKNEMDKQAAKGNQPNVTDKSKRRKKMRILKPNLSLSKPKLRKCVRELHRKLLKHKRLKRKLQNTREEIKFSLVNRNFANNQNKFSFGTNFSFESLTMNPEIKISIHLSTSQDSNSSLSSVEEQTNINNSQKQNESINNNMSFGGKLLQNNSSSASSEKANIYPGQSQQRICRYDKSDSSNQLTSSLADQNGTSINNKEKNFPPQKKSESETQKEVKGMQNITNANKVYRNNRTENVENERENLNESINPQDISRRFPHRLVSPKEVVKSFIRKLEKEFQNPINNLRFTHGSSELSDKCKQWKNSFLETYLKENSQLDKLPGCPCLYPINLAYNGSIFDAKLNSSYRWTFLNKEKEIGGQMYKDSNSCIRSSVFENIVVLSSQVCCYTRDNKLITRGSGAGTPSMVSPQVSPALHFLFDVKPWRFCRGNFFRFQEFRKPNNDLKCTRNPNGLKFRQQLKEANDY